MAYTRTMENMYLSALSDDQHARTCGYWYTVTTYGGTPLTAFRTKAACLAWLERFGLTIDGALPDPSKTGGFRVTGSFARISHMEPDALDTIEGRPTLCMDNGAYTLGIVETDADGVRVLHHLNCNVPRKTFDHAAARKAEDAGLDMVELYQFKVM